MLSSDPTRLTCPADVASSTIDLDSMTPADLVRWIASQLKLRYNEIGDKAFLALPKVLPVTMPISVKVTAPASNGKVVLPVTYYFQFDSSTDEGYRMCFSSTCAMLLRTLKPGALTDSPNADDEYLARVHTFGDTTSSAAQLAALRHFGVKAEFRTNLTDADVESQLRKGIPVPIGILHKGAVTAPYGGGHWILIIGVDGDDWIVNDPAGDLDLVGGGYTSGLSGKMVRYSKKNLTPRWQVDGTRWGIIASNPLK